MIVRDINNVHFNSVSIPVWVESSTVWISTLKNCVIESNSSDLTEYKTTFKKSKQYISVFASLMHTVNILKCRYSIRIEEYFINILKILKKSLKLWRGRIILFGAPGNSWYKMTTWQMYSRSVLRQNLFQNSQF